MVSARTPCTYSTSASSGFNAFCNGSLRDVAELLANLASAAHGDAFPVPTLTDSVVSIRDWAKPPSAVTTLPAANTSLCSSKMQ